MRLILLILLLLLPVQADADWDWKDTSLEATWIALHVLDWGQTLDIARNSGEWSETNVILGRHPSIGNVNLYMGAWVIAHPIISYIIPSNVRPYWQLISIGVTGTCVARNFRLGLEVRF